MIACWKINLRSTYSASPFSSLAIESQGRESKITEKIKWEGSRARQNVHSAHKTTRLGYIRSRSCVSFPLTV